MRYSDKSVSNSMLTVLKRSPLEFQQKFITCDWPEEEQSDALKLGSLLHCMVLERDKVDERFAFAPKVDGRTKEGRATKAAFEALADGKTIIEESIHAKAVFMREALMQHDEASRILSQVNASDAIKEKPVYGVIDDVKVAGTPDLVLLDRHVIYDLKTTQDATPSGFAASMAKYGYHRQAAMYTELMHQATGEWFRFVFIAVKTTRPYEVAVYEPDVPAMRAGMSELLDLINDYKRRLESDDWVAAWSKGVIPLPLPRWYRNEVFLEGELV